VIRGSDKIARRRALRETGTVFAVSMIPLFLGAFFAYVQATRTEKQHPSYADFAFQATLGGQLFLLFLSLAGTIFARLWDSDGPRYAFSTLLNLTCLLGAVVTAGLLAMDVHMTSFAFLPVGFLSLLFFAFSLFYYFILAIPAYVRKPDIQGHLQAQGENMGESLEARMGGNAAP
jgi:hypothetical protein